MSTGMSLRPRARSATAIASMAGGVWTFVPHVAMASTATATIAISATVTAFCSISTLPLGFGNYTSVQTDATTTVTVNCTTGTSYNVGLDQGASTGASVTTRKMSLSGSLLGYNLYSDTSRTANWGNTIGTDTVTGTGTGSAQNLTVYGRIPGGQLVTPGSYTDTVTATITY